MDRQNDDSYTVYAHRSKSDNKVYIGATKQKLYKRFLNGLGYAHCVRFWEAIEEQGFSNFEHMVIAEGLTRDKAMKMEEVLIDLLGTMNPNVGYNMRNGGEHNMPCNEVKQKISRAQMGHSVDPKLTNRLKKLFGRPVVQLSKNGNFISVYVSLHEAARKIKGNATNISSACHGKQATSYGFKWCFLDATNGRYDKEIEKTGIMKNEQCRDSFEREWNRTAKDREEIDGNASK